MMTFKTVSDIEAEMTKVITRQRDYTKVYTLDKMQKLVGYLGNPQNKVQTIHVAGTSGKTSTSYFIASMLRASGKTVGLTVSPHIVDIRERALVNLEVLPEIEYCKYFSEYYQLVVKSNINPSYFETMIAFSFWLFSKLNLDYAVIEVGLGGTLDCTNVISSKDKVAVITDIGFDHTNVLGKTIDLIAQNKAGIIMPGNKAFTHEQSPEIMHEINMRLHQATGSELRVIKQNKSVQYDFASKDFPLYQKRNWHLASAVYEYVADRDALSTLSETQALNAAAIGIPGRMETFAWKDKVIILDGAHNQQKLAALFKSLVARYPHDQIAALFGVVNDKFDESMVKTLAHCSQIITTSFEIKQDMQRICADPTELASHIRPAVPVRVVDDTEEAFAALLDAPEKVLLVTGSFFLVAAIRPQLLNDRDFRQEH